MPVKKLPKKLVKRLRKVVRRENAKHSVSPNVDSQRVYKALGRMENVDRRSVFYEGRFPRSTLMQTARVRQMNVSRTFPGVELVIKRVHDETAAKTIKMIKALVLKHNLTVNPTHYLLVAPEAYPVGKCLVAMAKTNAPTIDEIICSRGDGRRFLEEELDGKTGDLLNAWSEFCRNWRIDPNAGNFLVLGINNGKFVFMPLVDIY